MTDEGDTLRVAGVKSEVSKNTKSVLNSVWKTSFPELPMQWMFIQNIKVVGECNTSLFQEMVQAASTRLNVGCGIS